MRKKLNFREFVTIYKIREKLCPYIKYEQKRRSAFMEIKRITGAISTYSANKAAAPKKPTATSVVKKTDRVEFGFESAIANAKAAIAAEIKADASPVELVEAASSAENMSNAEEIAALILMG